MAKYGETWGNRRPVHEGMAKVSALVREARTEARRQIAEEASGYTCAACGGSIPSVDLTFDGPGRAYHGSHNREVQ